MERSDFSQRVGSGSPLIQHLVELQRRHQEMFKFSKSLKKVCFSPINIWYRELCAKGMITKTTKKNTEIVTSRRCVYNFHEKMKKP